MTLAWWCRQRPTQEPLRASPLTGQTVVSPLQGRSRCRRGAREGACRYAARNVATPWGGHAMVRGPHGGNRPWGRGGQHTCLRRLQECAGEMRERADATDEPCCCAYARVA